MNRTIGLMEIRDFLLQADFFRKISPDISFSSWMTSFEVPLPRESIHPFVGQNLKHF